MQLGMINAIINKKDSDLKETYYAHFQVHTPYCLNIPVRLAPVSLSRPVCSDWSEHVARFATADSEVDSAGTQWSGTSPGGYSTVSVGHVCVFALVI